MIQINDKKPQQINTFYEAATFITSNEANLDDIFDLMPGAILQQIVEYLPPVDQKNLINITPRALQAKKIETLKTFKLFYHHSDPDIDLLDHIQNAPTLFDLENEERKLTHLTAKKLSHLPKEEKEISKCFLLKELSNQHLSQKLQTITSILDISPCIYQYDNLLEREHLFFEEIKPLVDKLNECSLFEFTLTILSKVEIELLSIILASETLLHYSKQKEIDDIILFLRTFPEHTQEYFLDRLSLVYFYTQDYENSLKAALELDPLSENKTARLREIAYQTLRENNLKKIEEIANKILDPISSSHLFKAISTQYRIHLSLKKALKYAKKIQDPILKSEEITQIANHYIHIGRTRIVKKILHSTTNQKTKSLILTKLALKTSDTNLPKALKIISNIPSKSFQDAALSDLIRKLKNTQNIAQALQIANLITDPLQKEQTLKALL